MTSYVLSFAVDPHVNFFVEQGVGPGVNKEFLVSAVESGLTAVVSSFTLLLSLRCLCVLVSSVSVFVLQILNCVSPQTPMQHQCKDNDTAQYNWSLL